MKLMTILFCLLFVGLVVAPRAEKRQKLEEIEQGKGKGTEKRKSEASTSGSGEVEKIFGVKEEWIRKCQDPNLTPAIEGDHLFSVNTFKKDFANFIKEIKESLESIVMDKFKENALTPEKLKTEIKWINHCLKYVAIIYNHRDTKESQKTIITDYCAKLYKLAARVMEAVRMTN